LSLLVERVDWDALGQTVRTQQRNREIHTPLVSLYRWWARRSHALIGALLDAASEKSCSQRLVVSDPLSGGGTVAIEAVLRGHRVYAQDLHPWAVRGLATALDGADPVELEKAGERVMAAMSRFREDASPRPQEDWIAIPVLPIVDEATWDAVQEQLRQNSIHSRRNNKKHHYLLRGLIRCPRCNSTYTGAVQHGYRRYRCTNADASITSTGKRCTPGSIAAQPVELAVWGAMREALSQPEVLIEEYKRQLTQATMLASLGVERKQVTLAIRRVKAQEDRITDAYINEVMELDRYRLEMEKLRQRRNELEAVAKNIELRQRQQQDSQMTLEHLERFCSRVSIGLDTMTFEERQHLLRLVVERITVDEGRVRIETIIPTGSDDVQLRTRHPELVEG